MKIQEKKKDYPSDILRPFVKFDEVENERKNMCFLIENGSNPLHEYEFDNAKN